jgi:enoyl-CoA hydratase
LGQLKKSLAIAEEAGRGGATEQGKAAVTYQTIIYHPGRIARVILNRPDKLNAQNFTMLREMDHAFRAAVDDPACRVIVLSGEGRIFSAGHDLTSAEQRADIATLASHLEPYDRGLLSREIYTDSHLRWRDLPKPTIAMVHGQCIFGGWMIAAAMDFIFASSDAIFLPSYGDYFTVNFDVGWRKAKEILFATRFITAQEAMASGLVGQVFAPEELEQETLAYAERIAEQDPSQVRLIKFAINQAMDNMGFSTSVRAVGTSFITRQYPSPVRDGVVAEQPAPRPAGLDPKGQFKNRVTRALEYFRRDQAKRN